MTLSRIRTRIATTFLLALSAMFVGASAAIATPPTSEEAANTAVSSAADSATSIIQAGIPVVLGVAVAWVAVKFGKRLIGMLR